jgi:glutaredoxin
MLERTPDKQPAIMAHDNEKHGHVAQNKKIRKTFVRDQSPCLFVTSRERMSNGNEGNGLIFRSYLPSQQTYVTAS